MNKKVLAIVGSYRKGGIVDSLVSETLAAAEECGAKTEKIYLTEKDIEFCTNCRKCTQEPGPEPGRCIHADDLGPILAQCREADGLVIGAPVNFFNITAVTRRFMERLICFAYWPWGQAGPKMRSAARNKKAVLITATAMPAPFGRIFTGAPRALKVIAQTMGAEPIAVIFPGMAAQNERVKPSARAVRRARAAGRKLASP